jgi:NAD(P)H-hydrate epimerase
MNGKTLTREQIRRLDQRAVEEYAVPSIVLMENAGRGTADVLCGLGIAGPVVVCCGPGNNGGDGLVIARHLDLRGHAVRVLLAVPPEQLRGDAATNFQIVERSEIALRVSSAADAWRDELSGAAWAVDALLGTGSRGEPRDPIAGLIEAINTSGVPVLAVDLPSGLDCDTGQTSSRTVRALHTATFVAAKPGLLVASAQPYVGKLHMVDIGAPRKLVEEMLAETA